MSTGIRAGLKSITSDLLKQGLRSIIPKAGEGALNLANIMHKKGLPKNITQKFVDTALNKLSGIDQKKVARDLADLAIDESEALLKKGASLVTQKIGERFPKFRSEFLLPLKKKFREVKAKYIEPQSQTVIRVDEDNPRLKHDFSNTVFPVKDLKNAVTKNNPIVDMGPNRWTLAQTYTQMKSPQLQPLPVVSKSKKPSDLRQKTINLKMSQMEEPVPKSSSVSKGKKPLPDTPEKKPIPPKKPDFKGKRQVGRMKLAEMREYAKQLDIKPSNIPKKKLEILIKNKIRSRRRKFKSAI